MVAALAAGAVIAQTGQGKLALGANLRQRIIKNLNLTADQKAQAKTIFQDAKAAAAVVRPDLQTSRQALAVAIKSGDPTAIQTAAEDVAKSQVKLTVIRSTAMAKLYAMLTPAQQTQLDQMQAKIQQALQQLHGAGQAGN
jgi:Spy/CpxP family protein refolding chaperone